MYEVLQQLRNGKMEIVGELTLTAGAASTAVTDIRVSPQSVIVWHPRTANAAAELAAGTMYVTDANMGNGTFTVTHANNAQVDRTFRFAVLG
jgi:DNA-binding beta-propeller fold protein YncE